MVGLKLLPPSEKVLVRPEYRGLAKQPDPEHTADPVRNMFRGLRSGSGTRITYSRLCCEGS